MTAFWRPTTNPALKIEAPRLLRRAAGIVTVLWARCDLCGWSGPFRDFVQAMQGPAGMDVCDDCMGDERNVRYLLEHGWSFK
jgi:hypothetical protein